LFGPGKVRTGIDLGTGSVKLVRGEGSDRLELISHVGVEDWDPPGSIGEVTRAAEALGRLLSRLGLTKNRLGKIAVAIGEEASLREVVLPALTEDELRQALPFEAKKHLFLENMASPVMDFQILGAALSAEAGGGPQIRVLLAAASTAHRDFTLRVLGRVGLEPEVVDVEALASLNALFAHAATEGKPDRVIGLVDLGSKQAVLQVGSRSGGLLSRTLGPGAPARGSTDETLASYAEKIVERLRETLTFYRGRQKQDVSELFIAGGGALLPGLVERLRKGAGSSVALLDPLKGLADGARGMDEVGASGPRFVTACGLCRWWDGANV
jgi:type IV pilus assembly protein PilM